MSKQENFRRKVTIAFMWKLLERMGYQLVNFVIQVVLARLLSPEHFGIIAIMLVFVTLANVFNQNSLNLALVQNKDVDENDYSSVLYVSLFIAMVLYILAYVAAPFIEKTYKINDFALLFRVLMLILFFGAFNSIQLAKVQRELDFEKVFYSNIIGIIFAGIVGISLAYAEFGIWALVVYHLVNNLMCCIVMWFTIKWRPKLVFSISRIKILFSFGWKLLVSGLIATLYDNLRSLIVGKKYDSTVLGYYSRGNSFPYLVVSSIDGSIQSVMLPALSEYQDNKQRVKSGMRKAMISSSFFVIPMMVGLAAIAKPLVLVLLTSKWLPCVPFIQIHCLLYMFYPMASANLQAMNAIGRSDYYLKLEIIKKINGVLLLCIVVLYFEDVKYIAWSGVFAALINSVINAYPNKKLLNYSYLEQLKDLTPSLIMSAVMFTAIYFLGLTLDNISPIILILFQIISGTIVYIGLAYVFKVEAFQYFWEIIKTPLIKGAK